MGLDMDGMNIADAELIGAYGYISIRGYRIYIQLETEIDHRSDLLPLVDCTCTLNFRVNGTTVCLCVACSS